MPRYAPIIGAYLTYNVLHDALNQPNPLLLAHNTMDDTYAVSEDGIRQALADGLEIKVHMTDGALTASFSKGDKVYTFDGKGLTATNKNELADELNLKKKKLLASVKSPYSKYSNDKKHTESAFEKSARKILSSAAEKDEKIIASIRTQFKDKKTDTTFNQYLNDAKKIITDRKNDLHCDSEAKAEQDGGDN